MANVKKNTRESLVKKAVEMVKERGIDIYPRKIYRWPTGTWKNAQHH